MVTPPDRVREARAELDRAMERYANAEHPSREYPHNQRKYDRDVADNQRLLDAYAAALRAEHAAEIAALKHDIDYAAILLRLGAEACDVIATANDDAGAAQIRRFLSKVDAVRASEPRGRE